ncbi:hypothetical protein BDF19DRAFT_424280 [Syncephalis fuscata]|nr:hypothetical protein BDF19DRAFT_424280 [Syncephalis fuscata]
MKIIKQHQLTILRSALALLLTVQSTSAIPRDAGLAKEIFAVDPPQLPLSIVIPDGFNQRNEPISIFQNLKHSQRSLRNGHGDQYVLRPQSSFNFQGKCCLIKPQLSDLTLSSYMGSLSDSGINPIINVMKTKHPRRIEVRNGIVVPIDPPQTKLIYFTEWIENTQIDPRKVDLWNFYPERSEKTIEQIVEETFSKMPNVRPNLSNTKEQFKKLMPQFNELIGRSYRSGLPIANNDKAILLNTNGGIPLNNVDILLSPLKQAWLTAEMMDLLKVAQESIFGISNLETCSLFVLNGLFRLGIYLLMLIVQLVSAIPREANLPLDVFDPDPPQPYFGFDIPAGFDRNDEISWDQQLNDRDVKVLCRVRNNLTNQFRFLQDLKRKQTSLQDDSGRHYVTHPQRSFTFRGKLCFAIPQSPNENLSDLYASHISPLDRAKLIIPFFTKLIRGINYIHKVGWTNIDINAFDLGVEPNLDKYPIFNVMEIEQLRRIKIKNEIIMPIDPPQLGLIYLPEWIENTKIDPRKVDLWKVGELLYNIQYSFYPEQTEKPFKELMNEIVSKMPDVQPNLKNTQEQFKKFMPHFKKLIKEGYRSGLPTANSDRAILLNTNSGLSTTSIDTSSFPLKQTRLTVEILDLLVIAQDSIFGFGHLQNFLQFLLNGFFRLGIYYVKYIAGNQSQETINAGTIFEEN